jgi:hypothetical protein
MASTRGYRDDYVYDFSSEPTSGIPGRARRSLELLLNSDSLDVSPDGRARRPVEKDGQIIWLRRADTSTRGYRPVVVEDGPPRTAQATLAALTVQEGWRTNPERLKTILGSLDLDEASTQPRLPDPFEKGLENAFVKLRERSSFKRSEFFSDLMAHRPLLFALALLRHYRSDFDDLPRKEKESLLIECCERVDEVLKSVRLLSGFLEQGGREERQRPTWEDPHKAVEGTLLKDVEGLTHREIAEIARIDRPETPRGKRDYSKVRQTIDRGRDILRRAYGPEGYDEMVESMKEERRRSME